MEEIESLGKQERRELMNWLEILMGHLLKWQFQPQCRGKSWVVTIVGQRQEVEELIEDNPSLKPDLVAKETPLSQKDLPAQCPYTFEQVIDPGFYKVLPSRFNTSAIEQHP